MFCIEMKVEGLRSDQLFLLPVFVTLISCVCLACSLSLKLHVNPITANWVNQSERGGLFDFKQPFAVVC